jgi:hypothetical protein
MFEFIKFFWIKNVLGKEPAPKKVIDDPEEIERLKAGITAVEEDIRIHVEKEERAFKALNPDEYILEVWAGRECYFSGNYTATISRLPQHGLRWVGYLSEVERLKSELQNLRLPTLTKEPALDRAQRACEMILNSGRPYYDEKSKTYIPSDRITCIRIVKVDIYQDTTTKEIEDESL